VHTETLHRPMCSPTAVYIAVSDTLLCASKHGPNYVLFERSMWRHERGSGGDVVASRPLDSRRNMILNGLCAKMVFASSLPLLLSARHPPSNQSVTLLGVAIAWPASVGGWEVECERSAQRGDCIIGPAVTSRGKEALLH
jgi:hypothetical protein